jgi:nitrogen fixation protein FixH
MSGWEIAGFIALFFGTVAVSGLVYAWAYKKIKELACRLFT